MQKPYGRPNGYTNKCGLLLVLGVISTDVNVIYSHLFPRVNAADCKAILERLVRPWIGGMKNNRTSNNKTLHRLIRQRRTQEWMSYNRHDLVPPNL